MEGYFTINQMAKRFNVTGITIRNWIKKGLKYRKEKIIGKKERMIVSIKDVDKFLNLGVSEKISKSKEK